MKKTSLTIFSFFHKGGKNILRAFCFVLLFAAQNLTAQVTVAGSAGGNGNYGTLTAAFTAINTSGPHTAATIIVTITANTNEGFGSAILNSGAWATLTVKPAGGVAATISGSAAGTQLIRLNGADNVTIDGLNTSGSSLTISNTYTGINPGTSTIYFVDGATNNVVTNCTIQGSYGGQLATDGATIWFGTDPVTGNGNDNNTISNNNIGPFGTTLPGKAIYSGSSSSSINNGNIVSGNNIFDYFIGNGSSAGIYLTNNNSQWTIQNNRFYQTAVRTQTTGGIHTAIHVASTNGQGFVINGNTIGYSSAAGTGTYTLVGVSGTRFFPIYGVPFGSVGTTYIRNNTITAISFTGSMQGSFMTAPFVAIYATGLVEVSNNTIGSSTVPGSIVFSSSNIGASEVYGLWIFSGPSPIVNNNSIGGLDISNSSTGHVSVYLLRPNATAGTTNTIQDNIIGFPGAPITCNANTNNSKLIGIYAIAGNPIITGNTVAHLSNNSALLSSGLNVSLIGIGNDNTPATVPAIVSGNHVHSLSNTNTVAPVTVSGIVFSGNTSVTGNNINKNSIHSLSVAGNGIVNGLLVYSGQTISNNMISLGLDASGASLTAGCSIYGLRDQGGLNQINFNSVYIGGTGVTGTNNSYAFQNTTVAGSRDCRNNIFYNARSNGAGTGKHYAVSITGTAPNPAGVTSDFNDLFVSGSGGTLGLFNSIDQPTLAAWQSATGLDLSSVTANPQFVNPAGTSTTTDLHIITPSPLSVDMTGTPVAGITDDYDGQIRANFSPTDIGADAGYFTFPVLGTYPNATVVAGKNITITPSVAPINTTSAVAYSSSSLKGVLTVNPTTGVLSLVHIMHAGTYIVTVQATNTYGNSSTTTFTLTVTNPNCSQGVIAGTTNISTATGPQGVAVGDFNNDGNQDLATANTGSSTISIRLGNGAGGFSGGTDLTGVGTNCRYVAVGDFNGDGRQDLVNSAVNSASLFISLGDGLGGFAAATAVPVASFPTGVTVADFNNDGKQDLVSGTSGNTVNIRLGNGLGGFTAMPDVITVGFNWTIGVGDFNEDGKQDIAIATQNAVMIRLGDGAGNFSGTTSVPAGPGCDVIAIADVNHDNHQDFLVANSSAGTVSVRLGDGLGGFSGTTEVATGSSTTFVAVGDLNGDGHPDFAASRLSAAIQLRYGDGLGNFSGSTFVTTSGGASRRMALGDFNNDGYHDIAAPSESASTVAIRLGGASDINVTGNLVNITDGDTTPSSSDFTDFGAVCTTSLTRSFSIQNTGTAILTGIAVSISGPHAADFAIGSAPGTTVGVAGSVSFQIIFTPSGPGPRNATISITSTDCDEAIYDFAVTGTEPIPIVISSTGHTNVTCPGGSNGAASVTASGGTGAFSYNWTPGNPSGDGTNSVTGLTAQPYLVILTDANGCVDSYTVGITEPMPFGPSILITDVNCFGGSTGAINVTPFGATAPYTYTWLPSGSTTEDLTGLTAGTYSLEIRDANSCPKTYTVSVAQPATPVSGTTTVTNISCFGGSNGTIDLTPTGGTPGYTYNWGSGVTTQDRSGIAAGTYTVITTDSKGCTATVTATVTQPTAPVSGTTVVTNVSCFGGSNGAINLTPSGGTGTHTYNWLPSGPTTEDRTGLVAGTYSVQITDANTCTATITVSVTQPAAPVSGTTVVTNVSCFGGSNGAINLTPSGGTGTHTYNWLPSGPT
ncbi:MAG: hypothetical protein K0S33_4247, partial [Bacteroidetes bacterium]|nr:hypothetical protein [Bacteroidota bacterium]